MSRDWQKDMARVLREKSRTSQYHSVFDSFGKLTHRIEAPYVALEYWLQQYAAAQEEIARINCDYYADKQRFVVQRRELAAEKERADKLQEAINQAIKEYGLWNDKAHAADVMATLLAEVRSSLYPKEETK